MHRPPLLLSGRANTRASCLPHGVVVTAAPSQRVVSSCGFPAATPNVSGPELTFQAPQTRSDHGLIRVAQLTGDTGIQLAPRKKSNATNPRDTEFDTGLLRRRLRVELERCSHWVAKCVSWDALTRLSTLQAVKPKQEAQLPFCKRREVDDESRCVSINGTNPSEEACVAGQTFERTVYNTCLASSDRTNFSRCTTDSKRGLIPNMTSTPPGTIGITSLPTLEASSLGTSMSQYETTRRHAILLDLFFRISSAHM